MGTVASLEVRYLVRQHDSEMGEVRLVIAILEEAIGCFRKYLLAQDHKGRRLYHDAEAWLMRDDGGRPFSFEHICDVLRIDGEYLRRGLREWREQQLAAVRVAPLDVVHGSAQGRAARPGPDARAADDLHARSAAST